MDDQTATLSMRDISVLRIVKVGWPFSKVGLRGPPHPCKTFQSYVQSKCKICSIDSCLWMANRNLRWNSLHAIQRLEWTRRSLVNDYNELFNSAFLNLRWNDRLAIRRQRGVGINPKNHRLRQRIHIPNPRQNKPSVQFKVTSLRNGSAEPG